MLFAYIYHLSLFHHFYLRASGVSDSHCAFEMASNEQNMNLHEGQDTAVGNSSTDFQNVVLVSGMRKFWQYSPVCVVFVLKN